ncbi:MAG: M15 family metallopeptidase [Candidatus Paceibacterota bacterium]
MSQKKLYNDYKARITTISKNLGIDLSRFPNLNLSLFMEETELLPIGQDIYGRNQYLRNDCAKSWHSLIKFARDNGINILLISGFRSVEYQKSIWEHKLSSGKSVNQIIYNVTPPGYSEHHTGCAIDIITNGYSPFSKRFEESDTFRWLCKNAKLFGLTMTYTKNNYYGITYEPWHWSFKKT